MRGTRLVAFAGVALALIAAACSSPTADTDESDELARFKKETSARLDEIASELEGLDPKARRQRLIELAQEEGGVVNFYGVTNLDDVSPVFDDFEEKTEVTVNYFRAGSQDIVTRLIEEARAGFLGADVINDPDPELSLLDREGLLAPVDTPIAEQITPEGVFDTWLWAFVDIFVPGWNVKEIPPSEAPKTWEDVLTNYEGRLALELGDFDWFATLVKGYFVAEKGMTEEEAVDLFRTAARGATIVDGHTLMTELLAAGEFAVAASPFSHRLEQFKKEGAPLEWQPAVEPIIPKGDGIAIHAAAEHPASALLFFEYYLTDAQRIGLELDRQPANTTIKGSLSVQQYESLTIDAEDILTEFDKWSDLYDEIVQLSGEKVISE